jgi:hypothetical protein
LAGVSGGDDGGLLPLGDKGKGDAHSCWREFDITYARKKPLFFPGQQERVLSLS